MGLLMSQDDLARALREVGCRSATKRLVQRWESGTTAAPRPSHARALERVTGLPIEALGFAAAALAVRLGEGADGGHDVRPADGTIAPAEGAYAAQSTPAGHRNYTGIWLSRYEFHSSGRSETFAGSHYVVLLQHGNRLTARSLPNSAESQLMIDLEVDGTVVTGTWSEQTAPSGYYRGARYHGALQFLVEPTGHRMAGKWVGFGKDFEVNTGPWELVLQEVSTSKAAIEGYDRPSVG